MVALAESGGPSSLDQDGLIAQAAVYARDLPPRPCGPLCPRAQAAAARAAIAESAAQES